MLGAHDPQRNHLLAALAPAARERIYPHLQLVEMMRMEYADQPHPASCFDVVLRHSCSALSARKATQVNS